MPTPFMHLQIAELLLRRVQQGSNGRLSQLLSREWSAFYMGSVAADYQTICNVPRRISHFYDLPPDPDDEAYPLMLATYPELARPSSLSPDQAVFIAAYLVHLMLDLVWFRQILIPYFVEASSWGDFPKRRLVHNILLAYLDRLAFESLPDTAGGTLAAAQPVQWLPFAADSDLLDWRDMLVAQLRPGATPQTVEIYAGRLQMSPGEFADKLADPVWLEAQMFGNIPVDEVWSHLEKSIPRGINVIEDYLGLSGEQKMRMRPTPDSPQAG